MLLKEASAPFSDQTRVPVSSRSADAKHDSQTPAVPAISPKPATPLGTGLLYFEARYRLSDNSVSAAGNPQCLFLLILMAAQLHSKLRPNHPFLWGPFCHKYMMHRILKADDTRLGKSALNQKLRQEVESFQWSLKLFIVLILFASIGGSDNQGKWIDIFSPERVNSEWQREDNLLQKKIFWSIQLWIKQRVTASSFSPQDAHDPLAPQNLWDGYKSYHAD